MRPVLENLEDRALLSAIVVNTVKDSTDALTSPIISLRDAITRANASQVPVSITFDPKVFATQQTIVLTGSRLVLNNTIAPITITGPANSVNIYGTNGLQAVGDFTVDSKTTATLTGLIISGGRAVWGAGIANAGTLTLNQDIITGDDAPNGGGIFNSGVATLVDTTVSYCVGTTGGGIWNMGGGKLTLTNTTVANNTAAVGGGIYNGGGGVIGGTTQLYSTTIFANDSGNGSGAGVFNTSGATVGLVNTVIGGNLTVPANSGPTYGPDVTGVFSSKGYNLIEATNGSSGWVSTDLTGTLANRLLPQLTVLADNGGPTPTIVPLDGSPLIDHGSNALAASTMTDQRGLPRVVNDRIDIGAVETAPLVVNTISDRPNNGVGDGTQNNDAYGGPSAFGTLALHQAIGIADLEPAATAITFDPTVFATEQTITTDQTPMGILNAHKNAPITITAPAAGLIYNGNGGGGFDVSFGATATLIGLTITNTNSAVRSTAGPNITLINDLITGNRGGAVSNSGVMVVKGCTITGNQGDVMGGIINDSGANLTVTNTTIANNSGIYYTGGVYNAGVATLTGDTISGNTGVYGGGIGNYPTGTLTVTNTTIANNTATRVGGGIDTAGVATFIGDTISGNTGIYGGGIGNDPTGSLTVTNTTIANNTANYGGGIDNAGKAKLYSATIVGNTGAVAAANPLYPLGGGGVYNVFTATVKATLGLVNTIIAKNVLATTAAAGPDVWGIATSGGFNLIGETNGSKGWLTTDLTGTAAKPLDPMLSVLGFNGGPTQTMVPQAGSPALQHGSVALAAGILTDQRGLPRVVNGKIDIGSVEVQSQ
jgi:hypothetical protein